MDSYKNVESSLVNQEKSENEEKSENKQENLVYWRDIYGLVTGSKVQPTEEEIREELSKNELLLLQGLRAYEPDSSSTDSTAKHSKIVVGSRVADVISKLSTSTGLPVDKAHEMLSVYLLYGFRGSSESLKEIIKTEEKSLEVLTDVICFYYRERQFLLKTWHHILANMEGHKLSSVYKEFVEKFTIKEVYNLFLDQLMFMIYKERPDSPFSSSPVYTRFTGLFLQYQISELIAIAKLMLICGTHYIPPVDDLTRITNSFKKLKKMHWAVLPRTKENKHEPQYSTFIQFLVIHFIQILDLQNLGLDSERWSDKTKFKALNKEVHTVVNLGEDCGTIITAWVLVNYALKEQFRRDEIRDVISIRTNKMNCWIYFAKLLDSKDMEDADMSKIAHKAIYQVVYLSVKLFGISYFNNKKLLDLTALLLRDDFVIKHFWFSEEGAGLKMVLNEAEQRFPVEYKELLTIYTNIAATSLENTEKVLKRLDTEVNYCEEYKDDVKLKTSSELFYENSVDHHPLEFIKEVTIPAGTKCTLISDTVTYVRWKYTLPFWSVVHNGVQKWIDQVRQYPADADVKDTIIHYLKLINVILRNGVTDKNILKVTEDIFGNLSRSCDELDADIMEAVMFASMPLLKTYPNDIIFFLEGLKVIPVFDHIAIDYIETARGKNFHTNLIKSFLELVELKRGTYPILISYLEFVRELFEIQHLKISWASLAGLVFVLIDVLPEMNKWPFVHYEQRIKLHWLCFDIVHMCLLNVPFEKTPTPKTSLSPIQNVTLSPEIESTVPTVNLMGDVCLYSLLNTDAGITLLKFICIGEQQLFGKLETFNCWHSGRSVDLINTLHLALTIANRVLLYKTIQTPERNWTLFEREIFKEPRGTNQLHVVLKIASYIYFAFSSRIRYLALTLLIRFASNTCVSLNVCLGMEANIVRHLFFHPLYTGIESEEMKITVLNFVTECVHNQPSLAESFFNVTEIRKCVNDNSKEMEKEGILQIVLSIIKQTSIAVTDNIYYTCVTLLEALWKEKRSMILSYLRMHDTFFKDFCHVLFNEDVFDGEIVPLYSKIFSVLAMELYCLMKTGEKLNKDLKDIFNRFIGSDIVLKWSKFCIDPKHRTHKLTTNKTTFQGTQLLKAWNHFLAIMLKMNFAVSHKKEILNHIIDSLEKEIGSLKNQIALEATAEIFLIVITSYKRLPVRGNDVQLTKFSVILEQLARNYSVFPSRATLYVMSGIASWLNKCRSTTLKLDCENFGKMIQSVSAILTYECELVIKREANISKSHERRMAGVLCLIKTMIKFKRSKSRKLWESAMKHHGIIFQVMCATSGILKKRQYSEVSLFYVELLTELIKEHPQEIEVIDTFELQYSLWDGLLYPDRYIPPPDKFKVEPYEMLVKSPWTLIYIQGLNLAHTLFTSQNSSVRLIVHDIFISHTDYLCESLLLPTVCVTHHSVNLICAVLRLVDAAIVDINPWPEKRFTVLTRLAENVKMCVNEIIKWLNEPEKLIREVKKMYTGDKLPAMMGYNLLIGKAHTIQKGLLQAYILGMNVLRVLSVHIGDTITCDRTGVPLEYFQLVLPVPYLQSLCTNAIRYWTKVLTGHPMVCSSASNTSLVNDECSSPPPEQSGVIEITLIKLSSEDMHQLQKLSECSEEDIKMAHQLTLHVVLCDVFYTLFLKTSDQREKHILIREFLSELGIYTEFIRRYKYDVASSDEDLSNWSPTKTEHPQLELKPFPRLKWWYDFDSEEDGTESLEECTDVQSGRLSPDSFDLWESFFDWNDFEIRAALQQMCFKSLKDTERSDTIKACAALINLQQNRINEDTEEEEEDDDDDYDFVTSILDDDKENKSLACKESVSLMSIDTYKSLACKKSVSLMSVDTYKSLACKESVSLMSVDTYKSGTCKGSVSLMSVDTYKSGTSKRSIDFMSADTAKSGVYKRSIDLCRPRLSKSSCDLRSKRTIALSRPKLSKSSVDLTSLSKESIDLTNDTEEVIVPEQTCSAPGSIILMSKVLSSPFIQKLLPSDHKIKLPDISKYGIETKSSFIFYLYSQHLIDQIGKMGEKRNG